MQPGIVLAVALALSCERGEGSLEGVRERGAVHGSLGAGMAALCEVVWIEEEVCFSPSWILLLLRLRIAQPLLTFHALLLLACSVPGYWSVHGNLPDAATVLSGFFCWRLLLCCWMVVGCLGTRCRGLIGG